jgi:outer membrane protein TolC
LCKLYQGQTAEELAHLYDTNEKQLIKAYNQNITDRDTEIQRLTAEIQRLNAIVKVKNKDLSDKVLAQHHEIQESKLRLEATEKNYQFTTSKLQQLRDAVAHIELCVKEAKGI